MSAVALLLAGGRGERLGRTAPKAFVEIDGRPLFEHALDPIRASSSIDSVVVVVPHDRVEPVRAVLETRAPALVEAVVPSGATRQESVRLGLGGVPAAAEIIVCHDAARPLASPELFDRVVETLSLTGVDAVVPVLPVPDTVKRVREGLVVETVPREELWLAQTPQAFRAESLRRAHDVAAEGGLEGTDDAVLLESAGYRVGAVAGEASNFKVTFEEDLDRVERLLIARGTVAGGGLLG